MNQEYRSGWKKRIIYFEILIILPNLWRNIIKYYTNIKLYFRMINIKWWVWTLCTYIEFRWRKILKFFNELVEWEVILKADSEELFEYIQLINRHKC